MSQPSTVAITNLDQDLLWKYRFFLTAEKKALTRFLKCVDWSDTQAKPNTCAINRRCAAFRRSTGILTGAKARRYCS